jgi:hypothetical protein
MTEAEWLTGGDPEAMLNLLFGAGLERKLRLFACACVRRVWPSVRDRRCRIALQVAERFVDGQATGEELQVAYHAAVEATRRFGGALHPAEFAARDAAGIHPYAAARDAARGAIHAVHAGTWTPRDPGDYDALIADLVAARQDQCSILRDLVGNPFRPPAAIDPGWVRWNGDTVAKLAEAMYAARNFGDLPVLADALEEAGCQERLILAHCRGREEHFRGCWVVDAVLLQVRPTVAVVPQRGRTRAGEGGPGGVSPDGTDLPS